MAAGTKAEARVQAQEVVDNWVRATLLTGWVPGSGLLSGAGDQVMIKQVADCYGMSVFDDKALTAHLGGVVGSSMGGAVAAEMLSFVPVFGWAAKAGTLAAKAKLIGKAVIDYFEQHTSLL